MNSIYIIVFSDALAIFKVSSQAAIESECVALFTLDFGLSKSAIYLSCR